MCLDGWALTECLFVFFSKLILIVVMFQVWKGKWNDINIVGKKLAIKMVNKRISRDFSEEYSKLRFVKVPFNSQMILISVSDLQITMKNVE